MIEDILKNSHLKVTKQRILILTIINKLQEQSTFINIYQNCQKQLNKSTLYRIINIFLKNNILTKSLNYNNEVYYNFAANNTNYFTCIKCHKKEKLTGCTVNIKGTYQVVSESVEVRGFCPNCLQKKN